MVYLDAIYWFFSGFYFGFNNYFLYVLNRDFKKICEMDINPIYIWLYSYSICFLCYSIYYLLAEIINFCFWISGNKPLKTRIYSLLKLVALVWLAKICLISNIIGIIIFITYQENNYKGLKLWVICHFILNSINIIFLSRDIFKKFKKKYYLDY